VAEAVPDREIARLVRPFKHFASQLSREAGLAADEENSSMAFLLIHRLIMRLNELHPGAERWLRANLGRTYMRSWQASVRALKGRPVLRRLNPKIRAEAFRTIAFNATASIGDAASSIRRRLNSLRSAIRAAEFGNLVAGGISYAEITRLPFVSGKRIDHLAEIVGIAALARIYSLAAVHVAFERGSGKRGEPVGGLVRVSPNPSLHFDACELYRGRAFALTAEAAEAHGVPLLSRLPGGFVPLHAHCRHVLTAAAFPTPADREPLPAYALDHTWEEVEREWRRRNPRGKRKKAAAGSRAAAARA
jgi:hypothetical protein